MITDDVIAGLRHHSVYIPYYSRSIYIHLQDPLIIGKLQNSVLLNEQKSPVLQPCLPSLSVHLSYMSWHPTDAHPQITLKSGVDASEIEK